MLAGFVLGHALIFGLLALVAYVAGRFLTVRWSMTGPGERVVVSTTLGLGLLAYGLFALGLFGLLRTGPIFAALAGILLFGHRACAELFGDLIRIKARTAGLGMLAAGPIFVLALYPPTAFDETTYHLPMARAFARSGGLPFVAEVRYPILPPLQHVLSAAGLLTSGDVATHLVQFLAVVLTAGLLALWSRRSFGPASGAIAAAAWLGSPLVVHLATSGYIEADLALYATAALYAASRWREEQDRVWLALAASFAALAAGFKVFGLYFVVSVAIETFADARPEARKRVLALYWIVALALLAPVYGRMIYWTGNPVFPFCPWLFGANDWGFAKIPGDNLAERLTGLATLPWDVLFDRAAVGQHPPISPMALLGVPFLFAARRGGRLLLHAIAFLLLVPADTRFLAAVLPLACLGLAGVATRPKLLQSRRLVILLCVVCFLPGWLYAIDRIHRNGPLPTTTQQRTTYLSARFPMVPALLHLNETLGRQGKIYVCHGENMKYHFEGVALGDWNGPASYARVLQAAAEPERFHGLLKALGVEALVLGLDPVTIRFPDTPAFHERFRLVYRDAGAAVYTLR